jgi:dTDP-glucose 4,6-dehydratase
MLNIVVTGGLGFIGSHFIQMALARGHRVHNIDKVTYASNVDLFEPWPENYSFERCDVKDLKALPHCDYIVHFAAESHVDRSIANSDPFMNSNVLGTYNILELLKNKKIENMQLGWEYQEPVLIYIGTDEVFGDIEEGFFREHDPHIPSNPYSASKSCAEMLVMAWGRTYNLPFRITRTTNNYGERQHSEKLIPMCITKCLNVKVMELGKDGESYHISSDQEFSVIQIAKIVLNAFGKPWDGNVEYVQNRSGQDVRYALDNSKIKHQLGWEPEHTMESVMQRIIESYK